MVSMVAVVNHATIACQIRVLTMAFALKRLLAIFAHAYIHIAVRIVIKVC
jgi:hypothetical protein